MNILGIPILTLVTFFPVAGMVVLLALPGARTRAIKLAANIFTGLEFVATLLLLTRFDAASGDMQFLERLPWIKAIGAQYLLGVDGISLLLVLLTSLLTFLATLSSWQAVEKRLKEYYVFLLLLETGMIGVFLALDLLLFYVFWEVVLVPMYFLIGVWGGEEGSTRPSSSSSIRSSARWPCSSASWSCGASIRRSTSWPCSRPGPFSLSPCRAGSS